MFFETNDNNAYLASIKKLASTIKECDAIVIGAGSGLSTAAGLTYSGERFNRYFADFIKKYGLTDMYSAGFYPYDTLEEHWAYWSRHIYYNRYLDAPKDTYKNLLKLIQGKEYFVITTNVDHQFQKANFEKRRLFYTQGDYGLWQCSKPCSSYTYDNKEMVKKMIYLQSQMKIPSQQIPYCPNCGAPMTMNLRCDSTFVQDKGWYDAKSNYEDFLENNLNKRIVFLELGVGANTPVIIKYPFWNFANESPSSTYVCINTEEIPCPKEIKHKSVSITNDIDKVLCDLLKEMEVNHDTN